MSLRPEIFVTLERHCRSIGEPASAFVERAIERALRVAGVPLFSREDAIAYLEAKKTSAQPDAEPEIKGQYFTW